MLFETKYLQTFSGDADLDQSADEEDIFGRYCDEYDERVASYKASYSDKWLPCYAHLIQLVMQEFSKVPEITSLLRKVKRLVSKIKGKQLISSSFLHVFNTIIFFRQTSRREVEGHCRKRRHITLSDSIFHTFSAFRSIGDFEAILAEYKINNHTVEQWDLLEYYRRLLKPFADFTDILAKETEATILLVVPSVDALSGFLQVILIYLIHVYYKF